MPDDTSSPLDPNLPAPSGIPASFDKENAFLLYAIFCGDVDRTAHALDVDPALVRGLAEENKWDKKLKPIIDLKASSRAGDVERAVNRALNFTQVHRWRLFLERVIRQLTGMSPKDLEAFLFPQTIDRRTQEVTQKFSTRALADLSSAIEKCHAMTYLALNDTATERKERTEEGDEDATASELHLKLADAMSRAGGRSQSLRGLVLDAQLLVAQEHARVDLKPPPSEELPPDE